MARNAEVLGIKMAIVRQEGLDDYALNAYEKLNGE